MPAPTPRRLQRKAKLSRQRKRTERGRQLPADVEAALQARAGRRCELCGGPIAQRCHRHHRKLLSQGGQDDITNIVLLHPTCHHVTVHLNPEWSKENGWIVPAASNPARVPVFLHNERRVRLTRDGTYTAA